MRPRLRVLGKLLLGSLLLTAAIAGALQLRPIRLFLRDQLLSAIKGSLNGELELADVRWPMPVHLELSGLRLRDKHGTHVARLTRLRAKLRYRSLLAGQLELERLDLSDLYIDLADLSDEHGLLSVFARREPRPPEPAADSNMSPLPIVVRELCIDRGELRFAPAADQRFSVRRLNGCVRLRVAQHLQVAIQALEAQLLRNDTEVARIAHPDQLAPLGQRAAQGGPMLLSVESQLAVGKDMTFDARARVRNFGGDSLRALGVSGNVLRGSADLDVHASQSHGRLSYRAQLASAAGALLAHGELDAQRRMWLQVQTDALSPAKITSLSLPTLGFALDAQLALEQPDSRALRVHLSRGYYGSWPLPEVSAHVVREASGRVVVSSVQAKQAHAELSGHGQLQPDGAAEASLRLSVPNFAELAPLQGAALSGGLEALVSARRGADEQLDVRADVRVQQLRTRTQRAEELRLRAHVTGKSERPVVQLDVNVKGEQLELGGHNVSEVIAALSGGPERYELTLAADQSFIRLDGWAEPRAGGWNGGLSLLAALDQGTLSLQLPFVRFLPSQSVALKQLRAGFQKAALFVDGELDLRSSSQARGQLRFVVEVPDVGLLMQSLGRDPLPGRAELTGVLRGQLTRPALDLRLRYQDGPKLAGVASQVAIEIRADAGSRRSHLDLQVSAGAAHVSGKLQSRWSQGLSLSTAARAARHDLALELYSVSLAELLELGNPAPRRLLDGMLNGNVKARGNLDKLELTTHLTSRVRVARDPSSLDLVMDASYGNASFKLAVDGGDRSGQLLQLKAAAQVGLERQLKRPQSWQQLLHASAWQLSGALAERGLRELPWLASSGLEQNLAAARLALHASLEHEPHTEPSGIFEAQLRWAPLGVSRKVSATCNDRARGELLLSGKWAKQKLGVELHGGPRSDEAIRVSARIAAPFAEVLGGQLMDLPGLQLLVQLNKLDLGSVPWVCEQGAGNISLTAKARDLMTARAEVSLETETHALRWGESPPLDIAIEAHSAPQVLRITSHIQTGGGSLHLQGHVPMDVRARSPSALLQRSGTVQLDMALARLPMAALLGFVPAVARVSGTASGQLELRGSMDSPDATGKLSFDDVSLTLPRLGRHFSHMHLKAALDDNTVRLSDAKLRDLDGSATVAALLSLEPQGAWRAELNLNARKFPLRKRGLMMGRTNATAHVVVESTRDKTSVEVELAKVAVDLSSGDIGDVQSLAPNPEFTFIDSRLEFGAPKQPLDRDKDELSAPTDIHVVTSEPLWVRRDDFAVQMSTDLRITLGGKTPPLLQGKISLLRGYIRLLGQSFDIKRGRVVLSGGESVDPQLEITAEHNIPGGTRVRLEVKGFVRAPELQFFVNDQATTAGDALLAISGRNERGGSASSAQQQIASAAIGMTAGLLSLGARRELGDWAPMLSIEQGERTRVRLGIEADRFIPKILRGFVRGAYAEGIVASTGNGNTSRAAQGGSSGGSVGASSQSGGSATTAFGTGVLLELMLPKNFVWAGHYGPGQTWSFDLDWRP